VAPTRTLLPLVVLLAAGCVNTRAMKANYDETTRILASVDKKAAIRCSPEEYAVAVAMEDFSRLEFDQADGVRADNHVDRALVNVRAAAANVSACAPEDADGDGIMDDVDKCPTLAEDFDDYEDEDGCPELESPDTDNDGISDPDDDCPTEPEDLDGFMDTDGCPDLDNDEDTVPDVDDDCPMTPGDPENGGCPTEDTDGDGIVDSEDKCPEEPETKNDYLDEDGCPDTAPTNVKVTNNQIVIEEKILFESGRDTILAVSHGILNSVYQVLVDYPDITIRIEGHTDSDGPDDMNLQLSKARADAVFEYLLSKGIDARRMETQGFGETRPIDTNRTPAGKANNRRVEFHITSGME
jgi:outer membrane protein OmpA-like peptidoglycan-associated protein